MTDNGTIGDGPADLCDRFMREVEEIYLHETGRPPSQGEIADLLEFCSSGVLKVVCGDTKHPFSTETLHDDATPKAAKCGAKGCFGDAAKPPTGRMANVDPTTGEHFLGEAVDGQE